MQPHVDQLEEAALVQGFSGVVRVEQQGRVVTEFACGHADRANARLNNLQTRFGVASGTKGITALTIMSLVESGDLTLETTVRSVVGGDLPRVDAAVTVDHLLTHRSGVGDYLDEETLGDIDDYALGALSAHILSSPRNYIGLLNERDQVTPAGERFVYNNSGYIMLALVIDNVTGSFRAAVQDRVLAPAGMNTAGFFRSDDHGANTAFGYLKDGRTNVFHLPIIGGGDGGIYLTLDDSTALWDAMFGGRIVNLETVELMTSVVSVHDDMRSYGRGFWLGRDGDHVWLEGMDAGVSFQSGVFRTSDLRYAVLANTSSGAWPLVKLIDTTAC